MAPFFSIIMPVYNAEKYVGEALASILVQSYKDYEILLVNDGSKDDSFSICQSYQHKDSRIIFIDKENEGVAITRNRALDIARGEYIMFVDSDDLIYPETLKVLADQIKSSSADFVRYEYQCIDEQGNESLPNYEKRKRFKYSNIIMEPSTFMQKIMQKEYFLCMNVFKRSILIDYNVRFLAGCSYNEDTLFIVQYLMHVSTCVYVPILLYGYRKYSGAVTSMLTKKNYDDIKCVISKLADLQPIADDKMKCAIKEVIEQLALHIYEVADSFRDYAGKRQMKQICLPSPLSKEWFLIGFFGDLLGVYLISALIIANKIIRKIDFICGK